MKTKSRLSPVQEILLKEYQIKQAAIDQCLKAFEDDDTRFTDALKQEKVLTDGSIAYLKGKK